MAEQERIKPMVHDAKTRAKAPWVTPAIIRSSASQADKAGNAYDSNSPNDSPGVS